MNKILKWFLIIVGILVVIIIFSGFYFHIFQRMFLVEKMNKDTFTGELALPLTIGEGEGFSGENTLVGKYACKPGLKAVIAAGDAGGQFGCAIPMCDCEVCTKCGDGICGKGENHCNCPQDCKNNEGAPVVHTISSVDDCLNLKKDENKIYNPVAFSSDPSEQEKVNEIQNAPESDNCIFDFVDKHEDIKDKTVCDKIQTNYYKNLCLQRIAFHLKDPSLCTLSFLHEQSNVDGCFNVLASELNDKSLCDKASDPTICLSHFNK